ncbi:MAG: caspase family protein [Saprospiraceae bacterium]
MKWTILCLALFAWPFLAFGQTTFPNASAAKGATPVATQNSKPNTQNSTRAVVVGISDYQDKDIPDLRFADRDAEAFANFLRSPAGGGLDGDHLKVLTNDEATAGNIIAALTWLVEDSRPGDRVIISFSGHGDVEQVTKSQLGRYSPKRIVMPRPSSNIL